MLVTDCPGLLAAERLDGARAGAAPLARVVASLVERAAGCDMLARAARASLAAAGGEEAVARHQGRTDLLKLRLFQLVDAAPPGLLGAALGPPVLRRVFQVLARGAGRGARTTLLHEYLTPEDDALFPDRAAPEAGGGGGGARRDGPDSGSVAEEAHAEWALGWEERAGPSEARTLEVWAEDIRSCLLPGRPLAVQLADAAVPLFVRVFPAAPVRDQLAALAAVLDSVVLAGAAAEPGSPALTNCVAALLAALKHQAELGHAPPSSPEWHTRITAILRAALSAPPLLVRRAAAEALGLLLRLSSDAQLDATVRALLAPPPAPASAARPAPLGAAADAPADAPAAWLGVDSVPGHALALGCVFRYAGAVRVSRLAVAAAATDRVLEWARGGGLARAWSLHALALMAEYAPPDAPRLAARALALLRSLFFVDDDAAGAGAGAGGAPRPHPPLMVSLARLAGALLALLGPELRAGAPELRAVQAVAEELRCAEGDGPASGFSAAARCVEAVELAHRQLLFAPRACAPAAVAADLAALLAHPGAAVRRGALACLRQLAAQDHAAVAELRALDVAVLRLVEEDTCSPPPFPYQPTRAPTVPTRAGGGAGMRTCTSRRASWRARCSSLRASTRSQSAPSPSRAKSSSPPLPPVQSGHVSSIPPY